MPEAREPLFTLREALAWLSSGRLLGDPGVPVAGVSTDSRTLAAGDLFVALRGERFDAHAFAPQAREAGAAAVVVEHTVPGLVPPLLVVPDARRALGELARGWRARFALPVIAVTGSNGKTTVKEMIAAVLAQRYGEAARCASPGNLNNEIGVPLSVFRLRAEHRVAVLELGMNHIGEIAWLAQIAQPTVALVNNAQREHQEFMASVEATALENGAVMRALPADGVAVYPGDDPHTPIWRGLAGARRRIEFGHADGCAVHAAGDALPGRFAMRVGGEETTVALAIDGAHNVRNALAAAACCHAIGIDAATIAAGLAAFRPVAGRLVRHPLACGAQLIDDSYNANPDSVRAAIDVLAQAAPQRVLVLGDMGEVGERGPQYHAEIGAYARERGIERLLCLGDATRATISAFGARGEQARHYGDVEALVQALRPIACGGATVLVKGSRFMRMERVVRALTGAPAAGQEH